MAGGPLSFMPQWNATIYNAIKQIFSLVLSFNLYRGRGKTETETVNGWKREKFLMPRFDSLLNSRQHFNPIGTDGKHVHCFHCFASRTRVFSGVHSRIQKKIAFHSYMSNVCRGEKCKCTKKKNIEIIKWFNWPEFGAIDINVKREKLQRQ